MFSFNFNVQNRKVKTFWYTSFDYKYITNTLVFILIHEMITILRWLKSVPTKMSECK